MKTLYKILCKLGLITKLIDDELDSIKVGYLENEDAQNLKFSLRCDLNASVIMSVLDKYLKEKNK